MSDWYVRQFGDREHFALGIALGRDPHPTGQEASDGTWGGLSVWVRGVCLTRNVEEDSAVSDEVRWTLLSILQWLTDVRVRMVNEEPFPHYCARQVRDGCDWYNETEAPAVTLSTAEESDWFRVRSAWRRHHALRAAAVDVALPNLTLRRLGDFLEVSWDNETWGTTRRGLSFVEKRGTALVGARDASQILVDAVIDVTRAAASKTNQPELQELARSAERVVAADSDWKWLVHEATASTIQAMPDVRERLEKHTRQKRSGIFVPHSVETLVLRQAQLVGRDQVQQVLQVVATLPPRPMRQELLQFVRPAPAPTSRPWVPGYEYALQVRERLGWGEQPAPDLANWLAQNDVTLRHAKLPPSVALVSMRAEQSRGLVVVNPQASSILRRETASAAALGHLLLDEIPASVDGSWEHWPTAARARAFGVMLLMPIDGIREILAGRREIDASDVQRVMERFGTGPYATTYHLKNLAFIDEEMRVAILRDLGRVS